MPCTGRQINNSLAGVLRRVQTPAPETDSRQAGALKGGSGACLGRSGGLFLNVSEDGNGFHTANQQPAGLSDSHTEGMIGNRMCGYGLGFSCHLPSPGERSCTWKSVS